MAIPKITYQNVLEALKYIDENGIPSHNQSTQYDLISENGKKYPPKYVIAVSDHLANGTTISVDAFNGTEARRCLEELGFMIELKQEKYILTITADSVSSTDERFPIYKLEEGDNYKPLDVHMEKANGEVVKRNYAKGERRHSNQTMARIAFQLYEQEITALSVEQKEAFPVCKYNPSSETICGIYSSVDEFRKRRKSIEYMTYSYGEGRKFVIYCWNIFSTIIFVQECLKPGVQLRSGGCRRHSACGG